MTHRLPALQSLTGLRFLAALHVVFFHFMMPVLGWAPAAAQNVLWAGYTSVGLFFLLSGFVLAYNYSGGVERRDFWTARLARIYPVYLLGLVLGWAQAFPPEANASRGDWLPTLLANLGLLQAWSPDLACRLNCPGWSLSAELFFYLLFPFLLPLLLRLKPRHLLYLGTTLWALALLPTSAFLLLSGSEDQWVWAIFKFNPLLRLPEFTIGVALGLGFLQNPLPRQWSRPAVLLATLAILLTLANSHRIPFLLLHNGLLAPAYALLILGLAARADRREGWLSHPWMVRLGESSYALYLLHGPGFWWFIKLAVPLGLVMNHTGLLVYLASMLLLSLAVFHLIEEPARKWIRRRLGRKKFITLPPLPAAPRPNSVEAA